MARGEVKGGGGDYNDWVAIAEHGPLVMFRRIRDGGTKDLGNGPRPIVVADSVVCTGPHAGKITLGEEIAGGGMTNELNRHPDGTDLPCRMAVLQRAGRDYPAIVKASADEVAKIDEMFPPGEEDRVWSEARARHAEQQAEAERSPAASNGSAPSAQPAASGARKTPW